MDRDAGKGLYESQAYFTVGRTQSGVNSDSDHDIADRVRVAKRRRTGAPRTIGAPSEADQVVTPVNSPSATAFSTRTIKDNHILPLSVICARVFAASFPRMSKDHRQWEPSKKWEVVAAELKNLPDSIVQTLFTMLTSSCPHLLSHDLVKEVRLALR